MARPLPARPDLAHLKKQAKALVRSGAAPRLADAQRMVAREYGFASWTQLKRHVESLTVDPVDALVAAVKANDVDAAKRLLEHHAELRAGAQRSAARDWRSARRFSIRRCSRPIARWSTSCFGSAPTSTRRATGGPAASACSTSVRRSSLRSCSSAARCSPSTRRRGSAASPTSNDWSPPIPTSVHQRGGDGQTPLHVAATVEVARFLVEHGADVDALDVDHESTPVQYAIRDRQDVARYLIERGGRTDILAASALGDLARVQRFLDDDPDSVRVSVSAEYFPMRDPKAGGTHLHLDARREQDGARHRAGLRRMTTSTDC